MSTWSYRSPSASRSRASTSSRVVPGTVRMSTSMSTTSGIVFVFCPPCTTLGDMVVCVSAWHIRATGTGMCSRVAKIVSVEVRPSRISSGRSIAATWARQMSSMWAAGRYADEAAHDLGGLDQCVVGAERHRSVSGRPVHSESAPGEALLADVHRHRSVTVVADGRPATEFGQHVVGVDRVPVVLDHPLGSPDAAGLLVGDAEVDEVALGSEPLGRRAAGTRRPSTR